MGFRSFDGEIVRERCLNCKCRTRHEIKCSFGYKSVIDESTVESIGENYQIIQCLGCETISYRTYTWCSDLTNRSEEVDEWVTTLYPQRPTEDLTQKHFPHVPESIHAIYTGVIDCFNHKISQLCAIGLRMIVEGVCNDCGIEGRNLHGKINGLCEKAYLTKAQAKSLHGHRHLGNNAVHHLAIAAPCQLIAAIEIVEHLLVNIYEWPKKTEVLSSRSIEYQHTA